MLSLPIARTPQHRSGATVLATFACLLATPIAAQDKAWVHPDGTTHTYRVVHVATTISWADANAAAASAGGYLATVTSADENAVLFDLIKDPGLWSKDAASGHWNGPWIGGVQSVGAVEPSGGWGWSELESYGFEKWATGQPDDAASTGAGSAERLHFGGAATFPVDSWADGSSADKLNGYVVEFSGPTAPTTIGLVQHDKSATEGYTLFAPFNSRTTFLVDTRGRVVKTWLSNYSPGQSVYLLPNGNLLRCGSSQHPNPPSGGAGGVVEEFDWDNNLLWRYIVSSATELHHHDIARLPNGNTLLVVWDYKTGQEAIDAGRNPAKLIHGDLWPDKIIEVQKTGRTTGTVVWQWHVFDHLIQDFDPTKANFGDPAAHPELVDINYTPDGNADWMHVNAIDYNPQLDQIVINLRSFDEFWVIDHSTTMAEAAGHTGGRSGKGGDLLYRWGNPMTYRAGTIADRQIFKQHDVQWIPPGYPGAGNFLLFNNGTDRPAGDYSTADEITPPPVDPNGNYPRSGAAWGPAAASWTYIPPNPTSFYSRFVAGVQRLKNGNTLVCSGFLGRIREVTPAGASLWEYVNPVTAKLSSQGQATKPAERGTFRSPRYAPDYPAFQGRTLVPGEPLEIDDSVLLIEGSKVPFPANTGTSVSLSIRAGGFPIQGYFLATSATSGMIPVDHRFARMGIDPLLLASLAGGTSPVFHNYRGTLDSTGRAKAEITIPSIATLQGLVVYTTMFVISPSAPSTLGFISNTVELEIVN